MTLLRFLLAWFALSAALAPVIGRYLAASAETSTHACGGTLLFVREADGRSREQCSCGWSYDFDRPDAERGPSEPVLVGP
jgi:hypothetical protein